MSMPRFSGDEREEFANYVVVNCHVFVFEDTSRATAAVVRSSRFADDTKML